jgi:hypothetical protein
MEVADEAELSRQQGLKEVGVQGWAGLEDKKCTSTLLSPLVSIFLSFSFSPGLFLLIHNGKAFS